MDERKKREQDKWKMMSAHPLSTQLIHTEITYFQLHYPNLEQPINQQINSKLCCSPHISNDMHTHSAHGTRHTAHSAWLIQPTLLLCILNEW